MKKLYKMRDEDDAYVLLHKGFMNITLRIINCLVIALIYVLQIDLDFKYNMMFFKHHIVFIINSLERR